MCIQVEEDEEVEEQATVISEAAFFKFAARCLVQRSAAQLKMRKELKHFKGQ